MNPNEHELWNRIRQYHPDDPDHQLTFSMRLARENGWTPEYTARVIDEYKKFIFLCCVSPEGATPSDAVDQAWHLHLTYTRSYWNDLCRDTLERELHHTPTKGGPEEKDKYQHYYDRTHDTYRQYFGEDPPGDIWPGAEERFSDIDFQRVNRRRNWIIRKPNNKTIANWMLALAGFFIVWSGANLVAGLFIGGVIVLSHHPRQGARGEVGSGCGSGCSSGCGGDSGCSSGCSGCGGGCGGCS